MPRTGFPSPTGAWCEPPRVEIRLKLRRRYRELLQDEGGRTVTCRSEMEEELRHLRAVLSGS